MSKLRRVIVSRVKIVGAAVAAGALGVGTFVAFADGSPDGATAGLSSVKAANAKAANVARGALLHNGPAWYPRAIRLTHSADASKRGRIIVSTNTGAGGTFFSSMDGGKTFRRLGEIRTPLGKGQVSCCSTLFELPVKLGKTPAGTLLWAASVNYREGGKQNKPNPSSRIVGWKSTDYGASWKPLPRPIVTGKGGHGVWEPEFSVAGGGLVVHFSDKTQQPKYGQTIARVRSKDGGATWSRKTNTVAVDAKKDVRLEDSPGMPVVRHFPGHGYVMVYEYCNISRLPKKGHGCRVYSRTSKDGWNWGDSRKRGTLVKTTNGRQLAHAPTLAWAPGGGSQGRLLLVARLVQSGGDVGPAKVDKAASGTTILVNTAGGKGRWRTMPAPVRITGFRDEKLTPAQQGLVLPCQNYSSSLLPSVDGRSLLEVATDVVGNSCRAFYATGAIR
jgi:hypothetical protein